MLGSSGKTFYQIWPNLPSSLREAADKNCIAKKKLFSSVLHHSLLKLSPGLHILVHKIYLENFLKLTSPGRWKIESEQIGT